MHTACSQSIIIICFKAFIFIIITTYYCYSYYY